MLVRVDLGERSAVGALEKAREIANAVVTAAALHEDAAPWKQFGWELLLLDGKARLGSSFVTKEEQAAWPNQMQRDATAKALKERAPPLSTALAIATVPPNLAEALRSATEARDAHARSAIILNDRVVEFVSAHARCTANELVNLLLCSWPEASWRADLVYAIRGALEDSRWSGRDDDPAVRAAIETVEGTSFLLSLHAAHDHREQLVDMCSTPLRKARLTFLLSTLSDAEAYQRARTRYDSDTELLRQRLRRIRNALTHGNPVEEGSLDSVEQMSRFAARGAVTEALDAFGSGAHLLTRLQTHAQAVRDRARMLAEGSTILDLWAGQAATRTAQEDPQ